MTEQPYQTPKSDLGSEARGYGGLRRLPYLLWSIALVVFAFVALMAIGFLSGSGMISMIIVNLVALSLVVAFFYLIVLRFRNQGASGWWALGTLVPLFNIYVSVRALAYPEGYSDHKKFDGAAKIIVGLLLLLIFAQIVSVGVTVYRGSVQSVGLEN